MLQYAVIACQIQFALHLVQIPNFAFGKSPKHHNRASSMLYGSCDTESCSSFTNSLPLIDPSIWAKDFKLWHISLKDFILFLICLVFANVGPLEPFEIVLLPILPAWQSLLLTVDNDTVFHNFGSVMQFCLKQSSFCHASWWLW